MIINTRKNFQNTIFTFKHAIFVENVIFYIEVMSFL